MPSIEQATGRYRAENIPSDHAGSPSTAMGKISGGSAPAQPQQPTGGLGPVTSRTSTTGSGTAHKVTRGFC